jgi:anti-sigma factor RsiW
LHCDEARELLDARLDDELPPDEKREVDAHLASCATCAREFAELSANQRLLRENLMRYSAPDVLRARIRGALAESVKPQPVPVKTTPTWWRQVAAGLVIAIASSALTLVGVRATLSKDAAADELLESHVRSLMPGHLTDVVSTEHHTVKPWFNGRVDVSPAVPNLDSLGYPLVGGRTDYIRGRSVPVVVYGRRQHMINVYVMPSDQPSSAPTISSRNGYHFVQWHTGGLEYDAISDLNQKELDTFVSLFTR